MARPIPDLPRTGLIQTIDLKAFIYPDIIYIRDLNRQVQYEIRKPDTVASWRLAFAKKYVNEDSLEPKKLVSPSPHRDRNSEEEIKKREWNRLEAIKLMKAKNITIPEKMLIPIASVQPAQANPYPANPKATLTEQPVAKSVEKPLVERDQKLEIRINKMESLLEKLVEVKNEEQRSKKAD